MTRHGFHIVPILILLAAAATSPARAAPIIAGPTVLHSKAIQDITLLPGTPFNPTASPIVIDDLFGIGPLTIFRDAQVGSTITFSQLDGRFFGSHPALGDYVFGRVPPLAEDTRRRLLRKVYTPVLRPDLVQLAGSFARQEVGLSTTANLEPL